MLQLEDVEVALRGNSGVHAALAAVLYTGAFLFPYLCHAFFTGK